MTKRFITIVALALLSGLINAVVHADDKLPIYVNEQGSKLDMVEAIQSSIDGKQVYRCTPVEAKATRTGVSFKAPKKTK